MKIKGISDIFENLHPSKRQLMPDFPVLPLNNFAEINQEEIFCIVCTANKLIVQITQLTYAR